jgi:hypothetical protein
MPVMGKTKPAGNVPLSVLNFASRFVLRRFAWLAYARVDQPDTACLTASLVRYQPVFRSVSFIQRSPQDLLNKPGIFARRLRRPMHLRPTVMCGFVELLQSNFFQAGHT